MRSRVVGVMSVTLLISSMLMVPAATASSDGTVVSEQKISSTAGGFGLGLDSGDDFGRSVAEIGDLNDDGVTDLAVGAPGDDDGLGQAGAVYILFMNADGTVAGKAKISSTSGGFGGAPGGNDNFGDAVVGLGDLDGDGVEDIAVGEQRDDDGGSNRGAVWILFLNTDGTVKSEQKISSTAGGFGGSLINNGNFGFAAANIGDLDSDGVVDLAVGAFQGDAGGQGEAWVLLLNSNGTVKAEQRITEGVGGFTGALDNADHFGTSVASLGDIDGDGVQDLVVGALGDDDGGSNRGAAWILFLNADGTVASHQKISDTAGGFTGVLDNDDVFGYSAFEVGDYDGDGTPDAAIGARNDDDGGTNRGAVWVLFLNPDGTVASHQKISDTEGNFGGTLDDSDLFGFEGAGIGDFNGDGSVDLAIGATGDDDGGSGHGAVWILFMEPATAPPTTGSIHGFTFYDPAGTGTGGMPVDDAVVVNESNQRNRVCVADGAGGFACGDVSTDGETSNGVAFGDVNDDGNQDIAIANKTGIASEVCFGDGLGGFSSCTEIPTEDSNEREVALGHIDGDAHLDLVFARTNLTNRVCLGDGLGGFSCSDLSADAYSSLDVKLGHVDGDANVDAVVANESHPDRVCLGDGLGGFTCSDVEASSASHRGVALGLVDSDAALDAVFAGGGVRNRVCLGDGSGGFVCSDISSDLFNTQDIALGDLDGDGDLDVLTADYNARNRACLGDGGGGFSCADASFDYKPSISVGLGEFNGDGVIDAFLANTAYDADQACLGNGDGTFVCSTAMTGTDSVRVAVGDLGGPLGQPEGFPGVTFTLFGITDGGTPVGPHTAVTGPDGEFAYEDLLPGSYSVYQTVPSGYVSSTHDPDEPVVSLTLTAGEVVVAYSGQAVLGGGEFENVDSRLNFGNTPNTPPVVAADEGSIVADEGAPASNSGTVSDPDATPVTLSASLGAVVNNGDGTWSWSFDTDDGPAESQIVTISADDGRGGSASADFDLTVSNVAPTATFADDGPVDEGSPFTLSLSAPFDPSGADTAVGFEYAFDCGDGSGLSAFGSSATAVCATDDDAVRAVVGQIRDKDLGVTEYAGTVIVGNVAPTIELAGAPVVGEGVVYSLELGAISDLGADTVHSWRVRWGDGSTDVYSSNGPKSHVYVDGPLEAVILADVADEDGLHLEAGTLVVTVTNTAPVVEIWAIGDDNGDVIGTLPHPGLLALPVDLVGSFFDVGLGDTHSAEVDWGDETVDPLGAVVNGESFGAQHTYVAPGEFTVVLTVTDDDGGAGTDDYPIAIVDFGVVISLSQNNLGVVIADPTVEPAAVDWINEALADLIVAAEKWSQGKPKAAAASVRRAIGYLERAEDADPDLYLVHIKTFLTRGAKSSAAFAVYHAQLLEADPILIQNALNLIAQGDLMLAAGDFTGAVDKYGDAVDQVDGFLDDPPPDIYAEGAQLIASAQQATWDIYRQVSPWDRRTRRNLERTIGYLTVALDAVADDNPDGAVKELAAAARLLDRTTPRPPIDLTALKDSLAAAGQSLALDAIEFAGDNAIEPADFDAIDAANALVAAGDVLRAAGDFAGSLAEYKAAVQAIGYLI